MNVVLFIYSVLLRGRSTFLCLQLYSTASSIHHPSPTSPLSSASSLSPLSCRSSLLAGSTAFRTLVIERRVSVLNGIPRTPGELIALFPFPTPNELRKVGDHMVAV